MYACIFVMHMSIAWKKLILQSIKSCLLIVANCLIVMGRHSCNCYNIHTGNNVFGKDVATLLQRLGSSTEREAYILMDKINPPSQLGFILRPSVDDKLHPIPLISELGVFGVFVRYVCGTLTQYLGVHLNTWV